MVRVLNNWERGGDLYRLRVSRGEAVVDRSYRGVGPWRAMPYPSVLTEKLAEMSCGRQWREVPPSVFPVENRP